ncbi:transposase [Rhizobium leguminosarum]|uniref:transposase n=1 Tax=Rhizobium leguminosarum TaxID=384 RepID=UPI001FD8EB26|nr:transposase [Rhizobium leguminosarum]
MPARNPFHKRPAYEPLGALIAGTVNVDVTNSTGMRSLRLKASIGVGLVPPSVILRKLAASPRQNRLNQAPAGPNCL